MTNPDTQNMIDPVERQTGYRVAVDVISGIYEHAQMISARPEADAGIDLSDEYAQALNLKDRPNE